MTNVRQMLSLRRSQKLLPLRKNKMRYAITSLLFLALLTGCAKVISEDAIKLTTADIVVYDKVTAKAAAAEIESNQCPMLNMFAVDYGVMRDQTRVAKGEKVNVGR